MELVKCSLRRDFSLLTNNSPTSAGRIWVLWDPEVVHIRPVISNDQFLHCEVTSNVQPMKWLISIVYASNSATQRALLWTDLADLSTLCQSSPWIVSGDFNEVRYGSEKVGGRPIHSRRAFKFNRMISHAGLQDVKATGHHLSWNNNQEERVACQLDRTLVNSIWLSKYPEGFVHYHPPGTSDHAAMEILHNPTLPRGPSPFKFFQMWTGHSTFQDTVCQAWNIPVHGSSFQVKKHKNRAKTMELVNLWDVTKKVGGLPTCLKFCSVGSCC
ncbi:hypothetical protein QJS04_geneDACA008687 [Acorus gramineus]|uniref:Exo_endo_phos domain-containing protein n=1 Tax=Acorus gramineus TaxID=55184 RepID=A0AAV9AEE6_ACOGR|nr:hypothetical protein QJS04_geneDACA008687 [Acorus gramineus]